MKSHFDFCRRLLQDFLLVIYNYVGKIVIVITEKATVIIMTIINHNNQSL